jgi:hypothetical protein
MATIYTQFVVKASPEFVWEAIRDVGAVHTRLAQGFVTNTVLEGTVRTVTFANGFVVREQIVSVNDELRRLAYSAVGGRATHHNAYFQVFADADRGSQVLWVTDLLPDDVQGAIAQMVELGAAAIVKTLEQSCSARVVD